MGNSDFFDQYACQNADACHGAIAQHGSQCDARGGPDKAGGISPRGEQVANLRCDKVDAGDCKNRQHG